MVSKLFPLKSIFEWILRTIERINVEILVWTFIKSHLTVFELFLDPLNSRLRIAILWNLLSVYCHFGKFEILISSVSWNTIRFVHKWLLCNVQWHYYRFGKYSTIYLVQMLAHRLCSVAEYGTLFVLQWKSLNLHYTTL